MNVIGATLKLFGCISQIPNPGRFAFVFVGQAIAGISQTLFMGSPPKVASNWFQIKERTLATAVISLVNPIGIAIGTYLSPAIVKEPDDIPLLLGIQAAVMAYYDTVVMFPLSSALLVYLLLCLFATILQYLLVPLVESLLSLFLGVNISLLRRFKVVASSFYCSGSSHRYQLPGTPCCLHFHSGCVLGIIINSRFPARTFGIH